MAFIVNTAIGFPSHYYPQEVLANALRKYFWAMKENPQISPATIDQFLEIDTQSGFDTIDRFFTNVTIKGRYFMLPLDSFFDPPGIEESLKLAINATVNLAEQAVNELLTKVNLELKNISQLTSVTLVPAIPSIDVRLMNRIPFSPNLKRLPLGGLGCLGGVFGIARIADYLAAYPKEAAILFCVDPASLLWQGSLQRHLSAILSKLSQDPSQYSDVIMTIITAALFGDGAAAVLLVGREHPLAQHGSPQVIDSRSIVLPNTVHLMGTEIADIGFREVLQPEVADHVKVGLRQTIDPLLAAHNLSLEQISRWIVHPGGPKIIQAIEDEFRLDKQALHLSREVLAEVGNLSSPTVLYVLDKTLSGEQPPAKSYGLMVSIGPGLAQEVVLLRW